MVAHRSIQTDPAPLQLGRYRIEGPIGGGAMGVVYEARDLQLGRLVAIKILPGGIAENADRLARFLREARVLAGLHHPNIAALHGVGRSDDGTHYLVMERVEGESLAERLRRQPLGLQQSLEVGRQIARALAAAHRRGIVHRDLKPANVMLTPHGLIKVVDFGLAGHALERDTAPQLPDGSVALPVSETGNAVGTLGYMSPEQLQGHAADTSSDVFSFGSLMFECVSGTRAFHGATVGDVIAATMLRDPDWSAIPSATPAAWVELIRGCLDKRPERRPTDGGIEARLADLLEAPLHNLPVLPTRFIGRDAEIRECLELLERTRMLTLTGTGGSGKSRLAIRLAQELVPVHRDGVWLVDLSSVAAGDRVVAAVGQALHVLADASGPTVQSLAEKLSERRALVVLDNCEHVLPAVQELSEALLRRCPHLRLLATSREWLGVSGESNYRVPPLDVEPHEPGDPGAATSEAVRLFVDRARIADREFRLTDANHGLIDRICRRLDGIPLAIELAAALAASHELDAIEAQLGDRILDPTRTTDPTGARTMRAAIAWSWDRLSISERVLLRRLSVFVGRCTLNGATAVCGDQQDPFEVLDTLTSLVDRSLVVVAWADDPESSYRLLEPVRQFALSELAAGGELDAMRDRHLDYYVALAEEASPHLQGGPHQGLWLQRLEAEHENLLAALDRCDNENGTDRALRLVTACWRFWLHHGHFDVGRRELARALARVTAAEPSAPRADALFGAGGLAVFQGDYPAAESLNNESLELYQRLGDRSGAARARVHLGVCAVDQGHFDRARQLYEEALGVFRAVDAGRATATTLNNLGVVARCQGDYRAARSFWVEALPLAREGSHFDTLALILVNLALASIRLGATQEARQWLDEALVLVKRTGSRRIGAACLEVCGELLASTGTPDHAATLYSAATSLRASMRLPADAWWGRTHEGVVSNIRTSLGDQRFQAAWSAGKGLTMATAIDTALEWSRP
jgi:predicted ATPase